jgi:HK97 family phage portal protein
MKTIFDGEFETKSSKALGAYIPINFGGLRQANWMEWNTANIDKAYALNAIVYTCIHEISTSAANVPFRVRDKETKAFVTTELSRVLDNPNPLQDRTTFFENMYGFYLLKGNVGMEAAPYTDQDAVTELYCIPFDKVRVVLNKRGMVNRYIVVDHTERSLKEFRVSSTTGASKFMHMKTFNPSNMWIGQSPIEAVGKDVDIFRMTGDWNGSLVENAARPSGVFSYDDKDGGILTEDAYNRLKVEIQSEYVGAKNSGTPILLEGGLQWQSTSLSPVEMDFLNSRAASARIVANALGYPSMLLGLSGDNTYNNQKEARLALWTDTLMPLCSKMGIKLTDFFRKLGVLDSSRYEIIPDYEGIGALQPIRDKIWDRTVTGKDILTINERREMIGKGAIVGLDGIIANAAQVPLTYALTDPANRASVTIIRDNTTKTNDKNK